MVAHWSPPASTRVENVGEVAMKSELFLAAALPPRPGERGRRGKEGGGERLLEEERILFLETCLEASPESPLSVSSCLCTQHNGLDVTKPRWLLGKIFGVGPSLQRARGHAHGRPSSSSRRWDRGPQLEERRAQFHHPSIKRNRRESRFIPNPAAS